MKKTYTKPAMTLVDIAVEGMIAVSLQYDAEKKGGQMLSNGKGGWSSEDWADSENEE